MTAPSLYLHFRALGRPFLWAAYFSPSVHTGANECGSFLPQSSSSSRFAARAAGFFILTQCRERPER
jgi:hypothetical protein